MIFLSLSACYKVNNKDGSNNNKQKNEESTVYVEIIDRFENMEISDWLDENTVVVSKENQALDKMSLLELSDYYPRSLYLYNISTNEYKLLKEEENLFLGGATLSQDNNHLLYYEFALGDLAYYVMDIHTSDGFGIQGDSFGGAISAVWDGNEVFGATYNNTIYRASSTGKITILDEVGEEGLYIVRKIKDYIYYNTSYDQDLVMFNMNTGEKVELGIKNVYDLIPSPNGNQMLILQGDDRKSTLFISDLNGSNKVVIAEGEGIGGASWSPNEQLIAYRMRSSKEGSEGNSLYIYDVKNNESIIIVDDILDAITSWSPSGQKLAYTESDGVQYNSNIIHLIIE